MWATLVRNSKLTPSTTTNNMFLSSKLKNFLMTFDCQVIVFTDRLTDRLTGYYNPLFMVVGYEITFTVQ